MADTSILDWQGKAAVDFKVLISAITTHFFCRVIFMRFAKRRCN